MNTRIQALADQAGKYADETQPRGKFMRDGMWLYAYNGKFAELLVKECISTLEEKIYQSIDNDGDEVWADLILKQHFGVE